MKKILLRFDDICPTMNWEQWDKAKALLDKYRVQALLGVIPDCKDPDLMIDEPREDFWEYIKDLQNNGYTIAMHGLNHAFDIIADGIVTKNKNSEFAGHPYYIQYEKIRRGKETLNQHGIYTNVFFAPAHSYDDNTLKALYANGFKYISDGKSCMPYIRNGIICIPARSGGIPRMVNNWGGHYTVVLHAHEWVRMDKMKDWTRFCNVCTKYHAGIVGFDGYVKRGIGNSSIQRIDENMFLLWERYVRPRLMRGIRSLLRH